MTEVEVLDQPAVETTQEQVADIQIVQHSRGEIINESRPYMDAVKNDFNGTTPVAETTKTETSAADKSTALSLEGDNTDTKTVVDTKAEDKPVIPVVEPVVTKTETPDIYASLKEKTGRDIDEDYLTNDYRERATKAESTLASTKEQVEKYKHIFENPTLLQIADLMKGGLSATDILESMSIDVDKIPSDQLILDYIKREKPFLSKDDIKLFAEQNFGLGEDFEKMRDDDQERYFKLKEQIQVAVDAQKKFLNEKKVNLVTAPAPVQSEQSQENLITVDKVKTYKDTFNKHVDSLKDFQVTTDFVKPFERDALKQVSDKIVFSGDLNGSKVLMLTGIDDAALLNALYLYQQKDALFSEFKTSFEKSVTEEKSTQAFKQVSDIYNNVKGAAKQAEGDNTTLEVVEQKRTRSTSGW